MGSAWVAPLLIKHHQSLPSTGAERNPAWGLNEPRHFNFDRHISIIYGNPRIILDSNQFILDRAWIFPSANVVNIDTGFAMAGIPLEQKTQNGEWQNMSNEGKWGIIETYMPFSSGPKNDLADQPTPSV
jgi:hypothetical protein